MTPEEARDAAVAAVIEAGGLVMSATPMAHEDDPHTVVAYHLEVSIPTNGVAAAVQAVQTDTEVDRAGLVPWTPEPVDKGVEEVTPGEGSDA